MRLFLSLVLLTCSVFALEVKVSSKKIQNGKTLLLEFTKDKNIIYKELTLGDKRYKIFANPTDEKKLYALIPISYYEKPSEKKIQLLYEENKKEKKDEILFHIADANYKREILKVDGSKVTLNEKDKKRAAKEYKEAMQIYNSINKNSYISSKFIIPLQSKITSEFGKARVFNDTLKSYHGGVDFRADVGTKIVAINDGVVVLAKDRFYAGGSVIIDHGHGIYSSYFHMSKMDVKEGLVVKKGEVLGLSGKSGRITGPHLHLGLRVLGEQVDPLQFIELMNKNILKGI